MTNEMHDDVSHVNQAVIPSQCVRFSGETTHVSVPRRGQAEPKVELIRSGNKIRAIDVTCPCGQRIRLRCDYAS